MGKNIKAKVTRYNSDEDAIEVEKVDAWPISADGDIELDTGICVALGDGRDVVLTEDVLAALGYVPG